MGNNKTRLVLFSVLGLTLAAAACSSDSKKEEPNIFPSAYKQEIIETVKPLLTDPANVHDALISEPALGAGSKDQRYTVCVRYREGNRQNSASTDRIAYFFGGHLNQLVEANSGQCSKAAYKPFPELEKLCRDKKCE